MKGIIGAICGDIIGSSREFRPIKTKDFKLFDGYSCFTDDTVMTLAIASWLIKDKNSKDILISEFDDFWTESIFKEELKSDNSNYIVAKNGLNKIVGFGGYKILVDNADIMNIVTKKSARNTGIGTLILKNIIELIKFQNINHIILEVNENNIPAINLYKKFGFETIAERKNYYNGTDNAIIMELKIQKD